LIVGGISLAVLATGANYIKRALKNIEQAEKGDLNETCKTTKTEESQSPRRSRPRCTLPVLGIDLGSTNCRVAICHLAGQRPVVIENHEGNRATPAAVAVRANQLVVGKIAKNLRWQSPSQTMYGMHQLLGLSHDDPQVLKIFDGEMPHSLILGGIEGQPAMMGPANTPISVIEMSAAVLRNIKENAGGKFGDIGPAVLAVPANFTEIQRQALLSASNQASLEVAALVDEPVAAITGCQESKLLDIAAGSPVAVIDIGGRQATASILQAGSFSRQSQEGTDSIVLATDSCFEVGGEHFDFRLVEKLARHFRTRIADVDLLKDQLALQRLYEACETAKVELSSSQSITINLPFITADKTGPKHLEYNLSRSQFELTLEDVMKKNEELLKKVLKRANISSADIRAIVLIGGCSKMPVIQRQVRTFFGGHDTLIYPNDCDEVVVNGAAIKARRLLLD